MASDVGPGLKRKALAKAESVRTELLRAESRGESPPSLDSKAKCLAPLATFAARGEGDVVVVVWDDTIVKQIEALAAAPKRQPQAGQPVLGAQAKRGMPRAVGRL